MSSQKSKSMFLLGNESYFKFFYRKTVLKIPKITLQRLQRPHLQTPIGKFSAENSAIQQYGAK